ncbi:MULTISPECIES: PGPGW domain-containing protein [Thermoactinomyces]|jgi:uncharacterized protein|uniref:Transmembrane protein (PGPGW) n=1 Tax=Thermoactinomyces daqus TaxID=1329516 RepID=A0A7W1XC46_9BACL|nr:MULTISPECIES: PGPGW domain-containing protein [Thermoactinomyces]MBA4543920.1 hypothetical protein [Thermoactinomyces daqus]MBH8597434.1 hypothetical protein [Thermoactinomyces sp. CICC 10523]MBH8602995.1 hypothetical protein [Thermoactinomyces sp. CICC 10522]MBH8607157.1 hypothetical protein [Thermoactinomyces sp. CICC 10521]
MNDRVKHVIKVVLGWTFLVLGIIGFFVPILQGFLFTLIGLILLSQTTPWAKRLLDRLRRRYPEIAVKSEKWIEKWGNKFRFGSKSNPE